MLKRIEKTLSIGLTGVLALSIGIAHAADAPAKKLPNVLHEMVPHVVLPETIEYKKTAKNLPKMGYTSANSPYVATYVAYPSYQVPYPTAFRPVGQSVYPVSPQLLPAPLPKKLAESDSDSNSEAAVLETEGKDFVLNNNVAEPVQLASSAEEVIPVLPMPNQTVLQTGVFCQHPAKPPAAWAFSSPLFKVASVPAAWGSNQAGSITHNSPRGSGQQVGFQPVNFDPNSEAAAQQGIPYSTYQRGPMQGIVEPQAYTLPNGMVLLTLPQTHQNCGLIRCKSGNAPRVMLLPPAGAFGMPTSTQTMMPTPDVQTAMLQNAMMQNAMMQNAMMQGAMMPNGIGTPYMQVSQQSPMQMMPQMMMPQMQMIPVTAMTPMGPAIVGYQQVPMMNQMNPMMNPAVNPMMNPMMDPQMALAIANPMTAAQVSGESDDNATETSPAMANPMSVIATPYGYAVQVSADTLQGGDAAAQLAQMHQALLQQMPMQMPVQMPRSPYAGLYMTPFGYIAMNQSAGRLGGGGLGQNMMMNVGYQPMGMGMMGMSGTMGGMSVSDMMQIMAFINSSKPQRRGRLAERIAERREARRAACDNDPFAQLMQAWMTPYSAHDTTLRMPSQSAYPYGYFGAQASPMGTANYGGYHNLYLGNTVYPGLY